MLNAETTQIELVKPKGVGEKKTFVSLQNSITELLVGGREGKKFDLTLEGMPRFGDLHLILKEYSKRDWTRREVVEVIEAYKLLLAKNYPVPLTVRYFEKDDHIYLAMSDMTAGGKYWLWGFNDIGPSQERDLDNLFDSDPLINMRLSKTDLQNIEQQALAIAEKATSDGFFIFWNSYHVRKAKIDGKLEVVLLDVWQDLVRKVHLLANESQVGSFMEKLKAGVAEADKRSASSHKAP